jgi:hypothetical protein
MKAKYKIAVLLASATAVLLGGISAQAKSLSQPKSEQLIAQCNGGGYPVLVCEIVNGKKKCVRRCPEAVLRG